MPLGKIGNDHLDLDPVALIAGTRLGPYEILTSFGAGRVGVMNLKKDGLLA